MNTKYEKNRTDSPEINNDYYGKLIGKLLHISINSRPDISAAVSLLAQHIKGTRQIDMSSREYAGIWKPLEITNFRLCSNSSNDEVFIGFADANWAEDRSSRKSNTGFLFKLFGGTISWTSKKRTCVCISSTEAEIVALSEAAWECVLIRKLLEFLSHRSRQQPSSKTIKDA